MKKFSKIFTVIVAVALVLPAVALSQEVYSGKIHGASYVFNKTVHPLSSKDPKVNLERDFVLQGADGSVYFLSNVPRSMKVKAVNKEVKVYGEDDGNGKIFVHHIDFKVGDKYVALCNWEEKIQDLSR
jgi:hypothetical protein